MKKAIVLPNIKKDRDLSLTERVIDRLLELSAGVYLDEKISVRPRDGIELYGSLPSDADFLIVIGGDGSVIDASQIALALNIPLLGINLGKVGYLATLDPDRLDLLSEIVSGKAGINEKMLLAAEKRCQDGRIVISERLSVNDVVISHDDYLGISDLKLENGSGDSVKYRADGIIIATPTGSTAYSLSAGGPIISHTLDSVTVTPICPHSFFDRSIVYGPDEKITVSNCGDDSLNISVDGRLFDRLEKGETCVIYKSESRIKTYNLDNTNLFAALSKKINLLHDLV